MAPSSKAPTNVAGAPSRVFNECTATRIVTLLRRKSGFIWQLGERKEPKHLADSLWLRPHPRLQVGRVDLAEDPQLCAPMRRPRQIAPSIQCNDLEGRSPVAVVRPAWANEMSKLLKDRSTKLESPSSADCWDAVTSGCGPFRFPRDGSSITS